MHTVKLILRGFEWINMYLSTICTQHQILAQLWCDVGPPSVTLAQHHIIIASMSLVCWDGIFGRQ